MKETRNYINTIREGLKNWEEWVENGEGILKKERWLFFHGIINSKAKKLQELDAEKVRDDILEHGVDGIDMRLERVETYLGIRDNLGNIMRDDNGNYLGGLPKYFVDTAKEIPNLSDYALNAEITEYRQLLEEKLLAFLRVFDECEGRIKSKNPVIVKALENPLLIWYFFDDKKELERYINFCLSNTTAKVKAIRAAELADEGKIRKDCVRKPLHDALEQVGINVGSYPQWNSCINLI